MTRYHRIWEDGEVKRVPFTAEEEAAWDAEEAAWEPERRKVPKSVIVHRLIDLGKIEAAHDALEADKAAKARWYAADRPAIYHDDPEALELLEAIGADPEVILAE